MRLILDKLIASYWILAIIPSLIVSIIFIYPGTPYILEVKNHDLPKGEYIFYFDLDGDGSTEQIHCKPGAPLNNIPIMTNEGKFYEQWNISGTMDEETSILLFGDFDHDKKGEIYVTSTSNDSLFLSIHEHFDSAATVIQKKFIRLIGLVEGQNNSHVRPIGMFDQNGDGNDELYFSITTGFAVSPRVCMFYDQKNDKFFSSSEFGINFSEPSFIDIDLDGRPEIISNMTAPGNHKTVFPYSDRSAWLMVLTDSFTFKFKPIEFSGFGSKLNIGCVKAKGENSLILSYTYEGVGKPKMTTGIYVYDSQGIQKGFKSWHDIGLTESTVELLTKDEDWELAILGDPLAILNNELTLIAEEDLPFKGDYLGASVDMDFDGQKELVLTARSEDYSVVLSTRGRILSKSETKIPTPPWKMSVKAEIGNPPEISLSSNGNAALLKFTRNKNYELSFLSYPAIYFSFVLLIWATGHITSRQARKRDALKQQLLELQLQSIKSQLDPHFIFNVLNTISYQVYLKDKQAAYDALNLFTRLLRKLFHNADQILRTLNEEISFVEDYIKLEKLRFGDIFSFELDLDAQVSGKEMIPRMSIQIFIENAIKHGVVPNEKGGKIHLIIRHQRDNLVIIVEDNGVGRRKAKELNNGQGKGLVLNQKLYDVLNKFYETNIRFEIEDLWENGSDAIGTRVTLHVPLKLF